MALTSIGKSIIGRKRALTIGGGNRWWNKTGTEAARAAKFAYGCVIQGIREGLTSARIQLRGSKAVSVSINDFPAAKWHSPNGWLVNLAYRHNGASVAIERRYWPYVEWETVSKAVEMERITAFLLCPKNNEDTYSCAQMGSGKFREYLDKKMSALLKDRFSPDEIRSLLDGTFRIFEKLIDYYNEKWLRPRMDDQEAYDEYWAATQQRIYEKENGLQSDTNEPSYKFVVEGMVSYFSEYIDARSSGPKYIVESGTGENARFNPPKLDSPGNF